jgi:hypothetical protein
VRCIRFAAAEVHAVAAILRSSAPNVAGVARTMRFLHSGIDSPLFSGDVELLRHELKSIHWLLDDTRGAARPDRLAA